MSKYKRVYKARDAQVSELIEDNNALCAQLHIVQIELEEYYFKLMESEEHHLMQEKHCVDEKNSFVNEEKLVKARAEIIRLQKCIEVQKELMQISSVSTVPSLLGKVLMDGVSSVGHFLMLPIALYRIWYAVFFARVPQKLGGKDFKKVIECYSKYGCSAVEQLLNSVVITPYIRANVYTALARHSKHNDIVTAATFARLAYEADPRAFRLKWLAFKMYDASDVLTAEAMLHLLPADILMSKSEQRQRIHVYSEAMKCRVDLAKNDINI